MEACQTIGFVIGPVKFFQVNQEFANENLQLFRKDVANITGFTAMGLHLKFTKSTHTLVHFPFGALASFGLSVFQQMNVNWACSLPNLAAKGGEVAWPAVGSAECSSGGLSGIIITSSSTTFSFITGDANVGISVSSLEGTSKAPPAEKKSNNHQMKSRRCLQRQPSLRKASPVERF